MDYYSAISTGYDKLYSEEQGVKLEIIKENLKVTKRSGLVLDAGAGTGLSRKFFRNVLLLDKSLGMLKMSKGMRVCADVECLPFKDKAFDAVLCVTVIHNVNDVKKAVNEIKRVSDRVAITLLKKSREFGYLGELLKENLKLVDLDSDKDLIMVSK